MKKLCFIFVCMCLLGACAVQKNNTPLSTLTLEGELILQELQGNVVTDLQRPITIHFIEAENRVNGYAGCNQYFSSYTLTARSIQFHSTGRTKMYCEGTLELEERFMSALTDVKTVKADSDKLMLLKNETVMLEFSR